MKRPRNRPRSLFNLACRLLQSLLVALVGFTLACVLLMVFGAVHVSNLLVAFSGRWFLRWAIVTLSLMATAIVYESLR